MSVAARTVSSLVELYAIAFQHTFKMEKDVRLVILEHLSHKLYIHILDVDFLGTNELGMGS